MLLHLATWPDVEAYLKTRDDVIMPIGSTEQHGPNGLIGTDAITAEHIARGIGERMQAYVGPTIGVGMAQHHMGFAGSMTVRPSTLIAIVRDYVVSLAKHGFRRFYFVNGHGGNIATVTAAFSEIYAETSMLPAGRANLPGVKCRLKNWWETRSLKQLSQELFPGAEGHHATPSEVSATWAIHPAAARPMTLDPPIAPMGETFHDADDYRRNFPDGRIGSNPGLSSIDAGKRILETSIADLTADYRGWIGRA